MLIQIGLSWVVILENKSALISRNALFKSLSDDVLAEIYAKIGHSETGKGDVVFQENDPGDRMYFIASGSVEISLEDKQGQTVLLTTLEAGESFGEMALISQSKRTATAITKMECELLYLGNDDFQQLLQDNQEISYNLCQLLSSRLASTNRLLGNKSKSKLLVLLASDKHLSQVEHLLDYLRSIESRKVVVVTEVGSIVEEMRRELDGFYIAHLSEEPPQSLLAISDHVINFHEQIEGQHYISETCSDYSIESIVRRVTNKTVGIALSSGTAPGLAHIGVLKALQEQKIPIDYISGTSGGALYGALYAFGYSYQDVYDHFSKIYNKSLYGLFDPGLNFSGIFKGERFINKTIGDSLGKRNIEESQIPYAAVATDLITGKEVIITSGDVAEAIRASVSIPIMFMPVKSEEKLYVDGVVTTPIPILALENAEIDIKIAVYVSELTAFNSKAPNMMSVFLRSRNISADFIAKRSAERADVLIKPEFNDLKQFDYKKIDEVIRVGEDAAKKVISRIKRLIHT
jgi:NTE family protein